MKIGNWIKGCFLILLCLTQGRILAQSNPPTPPMPPPGRVLDAWEFQTTNWVSFFRDEPLSFSNLSLTADWAGNGLLLDSSNSAYLNYAIVATNGWTNISLLNGSLELWFSGDWNSSDGIGNWGTLLEAGTWNTNATLRTGAWGIYLSPDGSNIYFSSQTTNSGTNYLNAPISWNAGDWHYLTVTYSPTNSALYLEGTLVSSGAGVATNLSVGSNSFSIGSDGNGTGLLQARGVFNNLITYNYQLDPETISNNYAYDSQSVYPLPSSGGGFHHDSTGPPPIPGGGSNSLDDLDPGPGFSSRVYGTNDFYLQALPLGTNSFNNNTNDITVLLHGTLSAVAYEIWSTTNLQAGMTDWVLETNVIGFPNTNVTVAIIPMGNRPTLYFKAVSFLDTDQGGLPDWWQLKYFGRLGVDPYADPDGDGWNNLQEYVNGSNPNSPDGPPPPQNAFEELDPSGTNVIISWAGSPGPITGYDINSLGYGDLGSVSSLTFTNSDLYASYDIPVGYTISATSSYGSSIGSVVVADNYLWKQINLIRGPQGQLYLTIISPATNLATVRIFGYADGQSTFDATFPSFDVPITAFTNGIAALPTNSTDIAFAYTAVYARGISSTGDYSNPSFFYLDSSSWLAETGTTSHSDFPNASTEMKQNIQFLLRAATVGSAFNCDTGNADFVNRQISYSPYFTSSANDYVYSGFRNYTVYDAMLPAEQNFIFNNFVYNSSFGKGIYYPPAGDFDDSLIGWGGTGVSFLDTTTETNHIAFDPPFLFSGYTNPIQSALGINSSPYNIFDRDLVITNDVTGGFADVGITPHLNGTLQMSSGVRNIYGLTINSILVLNSNRSVTLSAGSEIGPLDTNQPSCLFLNAAIPSLETVSYYFNQSENIGSNPGEGSFSNASETQLFMLGCGQSMLVAGWAKQAVTNGYSGVYAYLQQYFDKAYVADTNGVATSTQTGILSPFGDFYATQPGPAALVTLPDSDTGQRGTNIIHVVKLQFDVNHDGQMDLSLTGPDNTSPDHPYVFWVNNNYDRFKLDKDDDAYYQDDLDPVDINALPVQQRVPDFAYSTNGLPSIPCTRDLEDYARLWIPGLTSLLQAASTNYTIRLSGYGIRIYSAVESDGGTNYLSDSTTANAQVSDSSSLYLGTLDGSSHIILSGRTNLTEHFIFCGIGATTSYVVLEAVDGNGNVIGQATAYIQLVDIKNLYERWTVGERAQFPPTNIVQCSVDDLPPGQNVGFQYPYNPAVDTNKPYILYVHGWNMTTWDKDRFAETAFKRLYWQGYQGRFGAFRWPTGNGFIGAGSLATNLTEKDNYDSSEFNAWQSASGLTNLLTSLNGKYPSRVYLLAHSMGNIVASEALRLSGGQVVNTYVASQGAISAHTYDTNAAIYSFSYPPFSSSPDTPNIYGNWFAGLNGSGAGRIINFYNTNDYALARPHWQLNQLFKPDQDVLEGTTNWYYGYSGSIGDPPPWNHFYKQTFTGSTVISFNIVASLNDLYEVTAYAAQSYTTALGATSVSHVAANVDLTTLWPSPDPLGNNYGSHFYHSAEFRGDAPPEWNYWHTLLTSPTTGFNISNP
ncbi:MAG TPA: LamG-like jellyroll fold domain-containing protein [Verrucomicrobiae bacterium]|jgi:hypothetical protein|nr:LamG-like jellyroll fold domain-containing protein [Verrucomicrobiae bacterium]